MSLGIKLKKFRGMYVEELIYKWQEANVRPSLSNPDTPVNRLIAEREEIEEQIQRSRLAVIFRPFTERVESAWNG
jgi:hypothetical protein